MKTRKDNDMTNSQVQYTQKMTLNYCDWSNRVRYVMKTK